ncbi:HAD-IB family hydrolase [Mucilaginibacter arboris]|uniref:HAD-IB family hydrolase n=1 Tax=Mucilaginibacter arboris TaxID=2682090 RepID=A0A7K1SX39_9SPHI|nr:HAD-IB family hydrolase [Mucilaginibacter arboris]MVN21863.1 HAD-IB family hydrolase [Mucilaginibacter arboris]
MNESKSIAFFDFDGTITNRDIFWDYTFFRLKNGLSFFKLIKSIPDFTLYLFKVLNNEQAKQRIFGKLFKGETIIFFNRTVSSYYASYLYKRIKKDALDRINWHKNSNHTVCIVSANFDLLLQDFAENNKLKLIATRLQIENNIITGKFATRNCYGIEKANRIKDIFPDLNSYSQIYAYGDSKGDLEMLELASEKFYCFFKK